MNVNNKRIAILGAGNIGCAIARGILNSGVLAPENITLTRRRVEMLQEFREKGVRVTNENTVTIRESDLIILAVTPQQLDTLIFDIRDSIREEHHTVVSLVSGVTIEEIAQRLGKRVPIVRAMPNTAVAVRQSMTCLSANARDEAALGPVKQIFDQLGRTLVISEELMVPATALCACGIAFFLRAIRAASQGGIEIGFHAEEALLMAAQTALGASSLLVQPGSHPEREVDKVTTPQGCTISGLNQMEHHGFSSALIKGITTSAKKAEALFNSGSGSSTE